MMGFARQHKSTGNMLVVGSTTGERFAFYKRGASANEPQAEEDYGKSRSDHNNDMLDKKSFVSDFALFKTKDFEAPGEEESAVRQLLLSPEEQLENNKWHSSGQKKLLGNDSGGQLTRLLGGDDGEYFTQKEKEEERAVRDLYREKRELRLSKSIGDFSGSEREPPASSSKCNESSSTTFFAAPDEQPLRLRQRLLSVMDVTQKEDRSKFIGDKQQQHQQISSAGSLTFNRQHHKADQFELDHEDPYARLVKFSSLSNNSAGQRQEAETTTTAAASATTQRIRRARKVRGRFRSTSLSSRISGGQRQQQQQLDAENLPGKEVSLLNVVSSEHMLDNDARRQQLLEAQQVSGKAGGSKSFSKRLAQNLKEESAVELLASQKSQGHPQTKKEEDNGTQVTQQACLLLQRQHTQQAGETKAIAGAECGGRQPMNCFVDVAHCLLMQEQQQQRLTGARGSSYYNSNDTTSDEERLAQAKANAQDNKLDKSSCKASKGKVLAAIGSHDNGNDNASANLTPSYEALPETASLEKSICRRDTSAAEPTASLAATATRNTPTTASDLESKFIACKFEQSAGIANEKQTAAFHYAPAQQRQGQRKSLPRLVCGEVANSEGGQPIGNTNGSGVLTMSTSSGDISKSRNNTRSDLAREFNNAATRLMGTCGQTWRQALQPNKSGSYKVARKQQVVAISGKEQHGSDNNNSLSMFLCASSGLASMGDSHETMPLPANSTTITGEGANASPKNGARRSARFSRPGRSPISLQRQTNARLTRHRLKIQQQRQEQLTQLALRERQQLKSYNGQRRLEAQLTSNYAREFMQTHPQLLNRAPPPSTNYKVSSHQARISYIAAPETANLDQQQTRTQQQVIPSSTNSSSIAIEICDNQLACSSRHFIAPSSVTVNSQRLNSQANVIAFKPINMLGNSINGNISNNDNHRQIEDRESISSDDAQTISSSSSSSLSLNKPFCKVCHIGSSKNGDKLISPCRCSGTMQYIHCGCLLKWLEISNRSNEKPMSCELCAHEYAWHKKFNFKQMQLPKCSPKDIFLHLIFIAALGVMLFSALSPILQKSSTPASVQQVGATTSNKDQLTLSSSNHKQTSDPDQTINRYRRPLPSASYHHPFNGHSSSATNHHVSSGRLAQDEKYILLCAASFFISFFLAIYVQTKARDTLCSLIVKFLNMNQTYYITEYDHGQGSSNKQQQHQQQHNNINEISRHDRKISVQQKS